MGSVREFWTPIYNAFDPWQVLWGEDLDRFFVERPDRPLAEVGAELSGSHMPLKVLLTGHRGSGKSTALAELVRRLANDFFIVWLDVEKSTDESPSVTSFTPLPFCSTTRPISPAPANFSPPVSFPT